MRAEREEAAAPMPQYGAHRRGMHQLIGQIAVHGHRMEGPIYPVDDRIRFSCRRCQWRVDAALAAAADVAGAVPWCHRPGG